MLAPAGSHNVGKAQSTVIAAQSPCAKSSYQLYLHSAEPRSNLESASLRDRPSCFAIADSFVQHFLCTCYTRDTMSHCKGCLRSFFQGVHNLAEYNEEPQTGAQELLSWLTSPTIFCTTPEQSALGSRQRVPLPSHLVLRMNDQAHKMMFPQTTCL